MQKWEHEYIKLDVYYEKTNDKIVRSLVFDCTEVLAHITSDDAREFIRMLDKEGWEMVSEKSHSEIHCTSYFFRRPLKG